MSEGVPVSRRGVGPVAISLALALLVFALQSLWLSTRWLPVSLNQQAIEMLMFAAFAAWLWSLPFAFGAAGRRFWVALLGLVLVFGIPAFALGLIMFSCATGVCF